MMPAPPCPTCGKSTRYNGHGSTLVGYRINPPHNHDDNCIAAQFICEDGHSTFACPQRKCPVDGCDWTGKLTCFCHKGEKVGIWTNEIVKGRSE